MTMVELEDKTAEALLAQAKARNLPLSTFLQCLAASSIPVNSSQAIAMEEIDALIDSAAGNYVTLPVSFSRADIYHNHD